MNKSQEIDSKNQGNEKNENHDLISRVQDLLEQNQAALIK